MSTKHKSKHQKESKPMGAVALKGENLPSADFLDDVYADAGKGSETVTMADMAMPFVQIAEALSPQINKRESSYIPGLEQGDLFNTATQKYWKGEEGFIFVPAKYERKYLVWRPDRGGFVGEHGPEIMDQVDEHAWPPRLPNGNVVQETAVWYGLIVGDDGAIDQAVLSLSSTRLKASKQLMIKLKTLAVKRPDGKGVYNPPLYYNKVRVTSAVESNDKGSWHVFKFDLAGTLADTPDGSTIYAAARALCDAVSSGELKAAAPVQEGRSDEIPF